MQMKCASLVVGLLAMLGANAAPLTCPANGAAINYPVSKNVDQQDNYQGTMSADPYLWPEAPQRAETNEWFEPQDEAPQALHTPIPIPSHSTSLHRSPPPPAPSAPRPSARSFLSVWYSRFASGNDDSERPPSSARHQPSEFSLWVSAPSRLFVNAQRVQRH